VLGQRYFVNSLGYSFRWLLGLGGCALFSQRTKAYILFYFIFYFYFVGLQGSQAG
jgi:hypothetical protein